MKTTRNCFITTIHGITGQEIEEGTLPTGSKVRKIYSENTPDGVQTSFECSTDNGKHWYKATTFDLPEGLFTPIPIGNMPRKVVSMMSTKSPWQKLLRLVSSAHLNIEGAVALVHDSKEAQDCLHPSTIQDLEKIRSFLEQMRYTCNQPHTSRKYALSSPYRSSR